MEKFAIKTVSAQLGISKDTLRYYDKIGLVSPKRGENAYRYYTQADLVDLMYVQVMKYAGFTLAEIQRVLRNKNQCGIGADTLQDTMNLLRHKKGEIREKIEFLKALLALLTHSLGVLEQKKEENDSNEMIKQIYLSIVD